MDERKCCFCFDIFKGVKCLSIFLSVVELASLPFIPHQMPICAIAFTFTPISCISHALLYLGVKKRRPSFILQWLIFIAISLLSFCGFAIWLLVTGSQQHLEDSNAGNVENIDSEIYLIWGSIITAISVILSYFWVVVYWLYIRIKFDSQASYNMVDNDWSPLEEEILRLENGKEMNIKVVLKD